MNKFCTNCGHELKPEEKFCPSCGFNTESVKQAKESVSNTQNVNSYQNTNQYQNANAYQNPNNAAFGNDDITMKNMLAQQHYGMEYLKKIVQVEFCTIFLRYSIP
mgnify:CR=1 FL=1